MTSEKAIEILKLYRQRLEESVSTELGNDIQAFDKAIQSLEQTDGDLISRQAVKDLIRGLTRWCVRSQDGKFHNVGLLYDDVMFGIDRLPSAEKTAESEEEE